MTARLRDRDTFVSPFTGHALEYFDHPFNVTRVNERAVEVPIALDWIATRRFASRGLEVGNVLRHYPTPFAGPGGAYGDPHPWITLDLTENAPGVVLADVMDIGQLAGRLRPPFDWVVTISTIEHVGWDFDPQEPGKALAALNVLRANLEPGGEALVSFPTGYHPHLDAEVLDGALGDHLKAEAFFRRVDHSHEGQPPTWQRSVFEPIPYHRAVPSAGGVWFGVLAP